MRFLPGLLLLSFTACAPTAPADNPFAPVAVTPENPPMAAGAASPNAAATPEDDAFAEPEPVKLSSEQLAAGTVAVATAAGVDVDALPGAPAASPAASPAAPVGLPPQTRWPVRLVSTLPQAQPPRAILGLPSGQEVVVSPGSMLADQGLVVIAVTGAGVELAQVEPAGDHAAITPFTLTPQYP